MVKDKAENFFVAGHSLPLWLVAVTLAAQSVDSNALLGNVDLAYKFQFWDGACTYHIISYHIIDCHNDCLMFPFLNMMRFNKYCSSGYATGTLRYVLVF